MPRFKAIYRDGDEVEGDSLDLARFVMDLASRPRGPSDLILVGDMEGYTALEAEQEPPAEPAPATRRRK